MVNLMHGSNSFSTKQMDEEAAYTRERKKATAMFVIEFFSRSVEVFLRQRFGERYFNLLGATSSSTMLVVAIIALLQFEGRVTFGNMVLGLYLIAYVIAAIGHVRQAKRRKEQLKSTYSGAPLVYEWMHAKGIKVQEYQVKQYIEPLLVFSASLIAGIVSSQLALWLFISAFCLFVRMQYQAQKSREKYLDRIDRMLEAEEEADAIRGLKQPNESKGVEVWGAFTPQQQELLLKERIGQ